MHLLDIVQREPRPEPWVEGDNIPWHEPAFSARMLKEHLVQDHDAASRRESKIDQQVAWIHTQLLGGRPTRVLDLGCGPGLYSARLARLGHICVGIDYSPASIAYARARAAETGAACTYIEDDIRRADYGSGYGLAMLIYGEFNIFRPAHIRTILSKMHAALAPAGLLLLEPHTYEYVERMGLSGATWFTAPASVYAAAPHLCLEEKTWDELHHTVAVRYYVIDAATAEATRYAQGFQAYTQEEYAALLEASGFSDVRFYPSLVGEVDPTQASLQAITARRL